MNPGPVTAALRHLRRFAAVQCGEGRTDRELLHAFAARRDEAAFAAVLHRHGPMVWRVCRRILGHVQDAEDAYQATFLVLMRKAASPAWQDSVAGWLHETAFRVARKAHGRAGRRRDREGQAGERGAGDLLTEISWREAQGVLDEELNRLPERYRGPLVLCYLEGATRDEAAGLMGWSLSTLKRRLERGRELLGHRLARRGLTLGAVLSGGLLASAGPGASLQAATLRLAAGEAVVPTAVGSLASAVASSGVGSTVRWAAVLLLGAALAVGGVQLLFHRAGPPLEERADILGQTDENKPAAPAADPTRRDRHGDPLPDRALARLGTTRLRHGFITYDVAFSPDGQTIASVGGGRGLCLWDAATGRLRRVLEERRHIYFIAFSPDGKLLADPGNDEVILWDVASGQVVRKIPANGQGSTMAATFSPDGRLVASAGHDKVVILSEVATGKALHRLQGHEAVIRGLAFSPDGKTVASGSCDNTVRLWDVMTGQERLRLTGHQKCVTRVAFTPDGKTIASSGEEPVVRLWDAATGKEQHVLDGGALHVSGLAFAPDGRTLASGHGDGKVRLWDVASGKQTRQWQAHAMGVQALAYSRDGGRVVTGAFESAVRLWDPATGKEVRPAGGHEGLIDWLSFSPDGKAILTASRDRSVRRWDWKDGSEAVLYRWHTPGWGFPFAVAPDGNTVALRDYRDHSVHLWDGAAATKPRLLGNQQGVWTFAFSPDGKLLATAGSDKTLCLWDVQAGRQLRQLKGHEDLVGALSFSPDGKVLASGAYDRTGNGAPPTGPSIVLWDVATGKIGRTLNTGEEVNVLRFSPNGKFLAPSRSFYLSRPRLWAVATGKAIDLADAPEDSYVLAFSPDNRLVALGTGERTYRGAPANNVFVLEVATGREVRRFAGHHSGLINAAFSPDGRLLATGGGDSTVLVWDLFGRWKDGQKQEVRLTSAEVAARWADLASGEPARAFAALGDLIAAPELAVPFLREHLQPARPLEEAKRQQVSKWIADLDSNTFAVREAATAELEKQGEAAEATLRAAQQGKPSLEAGRRLERLVERLQTWSPQRLRIMRVVAVLEYLGTPEARALLKTLAAGVPEALLSREAKDALRRMGE